jgi:hypothetical protein
MLSEALLEELRFKGEGSDLDYKAERYRFAQASDDDKSEMLKDILAFANAYREGTAYILLGFKENPPHPAEVTGLPSNGAIDDSRLQQFVNSKLNAKLEFRYAEGLLGDRHIAVISIPKQRRPFYLTRDFGKLTKDTVYVRRGSSTGIASPDEIARMGTTRGVVKAVLDFQTPDNDPLPNACERRFINFPARLPSLERDRNVFLTATFPVNADYYREGAVYHSSWNRVFQARLLLTNQSEFSLGDTHLEVVVRCPEGETASMLRADEMPDVPSSTYFSLANAHLEHAGQAVTIDHRGKTPVAHVALGTIRPGQTVRAEEDIAILPSGPGVYSIRVRILANEIPAPLLAEHQLEVTGPLVSVSEQEFFQSWNSFPDDED